MNLEAEQRQRDVRIVSLGEITPEDMLSIREAIGGGEFTTKGLVLGHASLFVDHNRPRLDVEGQGLITLFYGQAVIDKDNNRVEFIKPALKGEPEETIRVIALTKTELEIKEIGHIEADNNQKEAFKRANRERSQIADGY